MTCLDREEASAVVVAEEEGAGEEEVVEVGEIDPNLLDALQKRRASRNLLKALYAVGCGAVADSFCLSHLGRQHYKVGPVAWPSPVRDMCLQPSHDAARIDRSRGVQGVEEIVHYGTEALGSETLTAVPR